MAIFPLRKVATFLLSIKQGSYDFLLLYPICFASISTLTHARKEINDSAHMQTNGCGVRRNLSLFGNLDGFPLTHKRKSIAKVQCQLFPVHTVDLWSYGTTETVEKRVGAEVPLALLHLWNTGHSIPKQEET